MAKFIEVTCGDDKWLLNVNIIEQVKGDRFNSTIYLAFNCPDAIEQDYIVVEESYDKIREMLMGERREGE